MLTSSTFYLAGACFGSVNVRLTTSVPSGAPVGTTITLNASASDTTNSRATFTYEFSVGAADSSLQVRRDFYAANFFPWTPTEEEGAYKLQVVVHSSTGDTGSATDIFDVTSRVTGSSPVITRTPHPLVALYSIPPCPAGHVARVRFKLPTDNVWQTTSTKSCTGSKSVNFYVAGMRGSTTYQIQQDVFNGPFATVGPLFSFTTGVIPSNLPIPGYSVTKPFPAPNRTAYPVLLSGPLGTIPYASDMSGQLIWYLPPPTLYVNSLIRPLSGGTMFVGLADSSHTILLREYDLAGNVVRETNSRAAAAQLKLRGADPITDINHDAIRLPSGDLAFIGAVEKVADQGAGPVDVLGDQVVIVDSNFQVKFWWNEFHHLDIMRPAILGETCHQDQVGCPHLYNGYSIANDWTHSNALAYTSDGNILVSSRHQDWIMKFRYENGAGDGALLWRLGNEGDFSVTSSAAHPWFSHQHNVEVEPNGQLSLFDNGNTRHASYGGDSRGQAWRLDEASKVATLVVNLDLVAFSPAVGSAQLLSNGNYTFDLGYLSSGSITKEYSPSNALQAEQISSQKSYRSFRMRSLYTEH